MGTPAAPAAPPVIQLWVSATLLLAHLTLSVEGQVACQGMQQKCLQTARSLPRVAESEPELEGVGRFG